MRSVRYSPDQQYPDCCLVPYKPQSERQTSLVQGNVWPHVARVCKQFLDDKDLNVDLSANQELTDAPIQDHPPAHQKHVRCYRKCIQARGGHTHYRIKLWVVGSACDFDFSLNDFGFHWPLFHHLVLKKLIIIQIVSKKKKFNLNNNFNKIWCVIKVLPFFCTIYLN